MKIAITADPFIPVPPQTYGGIERIIDMLIRQLIKKGHEVTLFAHQDSTPDCKLITYNTAGNKINDTLSNSLKISNTSKKQQFDIIHSFGRLAYLFPLLFSKIPKLMSYQREPTLSQVKKATKIAQTGSLTFTGCSNYITDKIKPFATAHTVYNCVDTDKYKPADNVADNAPLVFLGRVEEIKGAHTAIEIASRTGRNLIIAGNVNESHRGYFEGQIKPFLGNQISYVGPVNDEQKNDLLRDATALLMPIQWNEPFGIVMIEAMACGTPVIGFNRGAVPEVVKHEQTGFVGDTLDELIGFVDEIGSIDRSQVRQYVEQHFSSEVIASQYLNLYESLIASGRAG